MKMLEEHIKYLGVQHCVVCDFFVEEDALGFESLDDLLVLSFRLM